MRDAIITGNPGGKVGVGEGVDLQGFVFHENGAGRFHELLVREDADVGQVQEAFA